MFPSEKTRSSFTLIELLVVLALVAILSVVVILTLNPAELIKQARDSNRLSDLSTINTALNLFSADVTSGFMGTSTIVYVSIPDNASSTCGSLGLPTLPSGYTYNCVSTTNLRNTNGTGWIPVNFQRISSNSPISQLPIDPINTTSTRLYYTYIAGGSWELNASIEAGKNKLGGSGDLVSKDGGSAASQYEIGNNLNLNPLETGDTSLVGYWNFEEGSGIASADRSGYGNNLAWNTGSPTWSTSGCVKGNCLSESGDDHYFQILSNGLISPTGDLSLVSWFKPTGQTTAFWILKNGEYGFQWRGSSATIAAYDGQYHYTAKATWNLNQWYQIAMAVRGNTVSVYIDGSLDSTFAVDARNFIGAVIAIGNAINSFPGSIDNTYLYNRALSAAEVSALYNSTK